MNRSGVYAVAGVQESTFSPWAMYTVLDFELAETRRLYRRDRNGPQGLSPVQ